MLGLVLPKRAGAINEQCLPDHRVVSIIGYSILLLFLAIMLMIFYAQLD
jgi:hypothetical protein